MKLTDIRNLDHALLSGKTKATQTPQLIESLMLHRGLTCTYCYHSSNLSLKPCWIIDDIKVRVTNPGLTCSIITLLCLFAVFKSWCIVFFGIKFLCSFCCRNLMNLKGRKYSRGEPSQRATWLKRGLSQRSKSMQCTLAQGAKVDQGLTGLHAIEINQYSILEENKKKKTFTEFWFMFLFS